jgi:ribose 5-phosphate isomerase A
MADFESAKRNAANKAVADHFDPSAKYVGIGSGSTIVYVVDAIRDFKDDRVSDILYVPTGHQSRELIIKAGLKDVRFDSLPKDTLMDVSFDGADEVDEDLNCIKGGGACLYQEKLVATHSRKFICVADHRKLQPRLLSKWPSIPIEVEPLAVSAVLSALSLLGSDTPSIRKDKKENAEPIKTDQNNYIVDAPFPTLLLPRDCAKSLSLHPTHKGMEGKGEGGKWDVETLAREIKLIEGVLSVGLFVGQNGLQAQQAGQKKGGQKPVAVYFGMEDGSVEVRNADGLGQERPVDS